MENQKITSLIIFRQTRMLADLSLIGCYNSSYMNQEERNRVMLASAKRNLLSIAFFGLTEFQKVKNTKKYFEILVIMIELLFFS